MTHYGPKGRLLIDADADDDDYDDDNHLPSHGKIGRYNVLAQK